jgi:exonuclease III
VDYDQTFPDGEAVPATFSCLTYNIWGLARTEEQKYLFGLRHPLLEKTIRESGADLLCLQEMSHFSYTQLEGLIREYPFASELPYPAATARPISERNRAVDTYFLSKYRPSRVTLYGLPGVLGYENCLLVIEFPNLVVFNLYNQAGSRSSPGQEHKWIHYSRCRYDILQTILDMIMLRYSDKSNIVCGDFNFHLDGSLEDWPEMEMLQQYAAYGFIDTFRRLNLDEPGFTEDTDRNPMRWNQKLIEKHYRYDGILYRPVGTGSRWNPRKSILIGTRHECLGAADSKWFIEKMSEVKPDELDKLTHCAYNRSGKLLVPINASDHFGVRTVFATPSRKTRRNRKSGSRMTRSASR